MKSLIEELFAEQMRLYKPAREYRFHPTRKWRFDCAWPLRMIAVEIEGGIYTGGAHTRAKGFSEDCEKYNEATALGWRVYRFTGEMVKKGVAMEFMKRVLE